MARLNYEDFEITVDDDPLTNSIQQNLNLLRFNPIEKRQYTIFRVPSYIRELNKSFYEPRIVSIGPYHRGGAHLKAMEAQKWLYVRKLLSQNPDMKLNAYVRELQELESAARRCYYESVDHIDSNEFVKMMLLDSMFIIQVVVNWSHRSDDNEQDIVFDIPWNVPLIKSDFLMLENQIPFFVLERVFELFSTRDKLGSTCSSPSNYDTMSEESEIEKASLSDVLFGFLEHGDEKFLEFNPSSNYDHLLHFYYDYYMSMQKVPIRYRKNTLLQKLKPKKVFPLLSSRLKMFTIRKNQEPNKTKRCPRMIPCASELKEAGISFKKSLSKSIFDVNFSCGVLKIPYIPVEENTRPRIMNLIAFEQCNSEKEKPLTSYAVLMDCIVNTPRDVLILQQGGILENKLADEGEAAMFFNQLRYCSYLDYDEHHLAGLFHDVKKYCESKWQKYRAKLCRDYFNSPWAIISFFAAVFLLFLTAIQSVYSVLGYYQH